MRVIWLAWLGAAIIVLSGAAWAVGVALDGGPSDSALGFDAYVLVFFSPAAALTGLTIGLTGFVKGRSWVWIFVVWLAVQTVVVWRHLFHGWCCTV